MSLYRLHFTWKNKQRTLHATGLDMTHPYFVSITGIRFPDASALIIDPNGDDLEREFGRALNLMIPFQNVTLIEELPDEKPRTGNVIPFSVVEGGADPDESTDDGE